MKILITSGGTKIDIDLVRHIGNMSKGTFGSDICKAFLERGHTVDFLMAEDSKTPFEFRCVFDDGIQSIEDKFKIWMDFTRKYGSCYKDYKYKTFDNYKEKIEMLLTLNYYDMVILSAAVSDFEVENVVNGKIRSQKDLEIRLKSLPKIIGKIKEYQLNTFLVGFKLLVNSTENDLQYEAKKSIDVNGCNVVVANDLRDIRADNHKLLIVSKENNGYKVDTKTKQSVESAGITLAESLVESLYKLYQNEKKESL